MLNEHLSFNLVFTRESEVSKHLSARTQARFQFLAISKYFYPVITNHRDGKSGGEQPY